jgi:hypothetical protein
MSKSWRTAWTALALALAVAVGGCATMSLNTITNLTPSRLPRKDNDQYWFSVEFDSRQRTMIRESQRTLVIVGDEVYEMNRVPLTANRWETLVPVPADQSVVNYFYRFEFDHKAIPEPRFMVIDSKPYRLTITSAW